MNDLVRRLSHDQPVVASLRPEPTAAAFKAALERGYVHVLFTETRGGTELGVRVDPAHLDLASVDWERRTVENPSAGWVVFESASLTTLGRTYSKAFTTNPVVPLHWTVPPGIKQRISFSFELDGPIFRAEGPTADLGLFYRRDQGLLRRLSIPLRKERQWWSWLG